MREDLQKFYTDPEILNVARYGQETLKQLIGRQKRDMTGIWDEYTVYSGETGEELTNSQI
jgi:hypothetical protein